MANIAVGRATRLAKYLAGGVMLSDLKLRDNYSSDDSNIVDDLFRPCLRESEIYYRSVGFLDSKMLAHLAVELEGLANRGGGARLLIGRTVTYEDYLAIKEGKLDPARFLLIPDLDILWAETSAEQIKRRGLLVLSWLVARGTLAIRFSIRPKGIHHDKFAFFQDSNGNEVVAHGTNNETEAANVPEVNYESLSVFRNWEPEIYGRLGEYKLREFLRLWEGKSKSALSVEPPNPILEKIAFLAEQHRYDPAYSDLFNQLREVQRQQESLPRIPIFWGEQRYQLFPHQKKAVNSFIDNDYRGIFALATGSGKTVTALHVVTELSRLLAINNNADVIVVIAVPYQVLADQWIEVLHEFGYRTVSAYGSVSQWFEKLDYAIDRLTFEPAARVTAVVVVNRTLQSDAFQNLIRQVPSSQLIFVGDECHRLGASIQRGKCPESDYRLGLSATPWAPHEEELKASLCCYFGKPIAHYGLADAFHDHVLAPYSYFLTEVALDAKEGELYTEHTLEIKKLTAIKLAGGNINDEALDFHRNQRAAVVGSVHQKFLELPAVLDDVGREMGLRNLLVYCGSGITDDDDEATGSVRDIERAQMIAATERGIQSARVTADESSNVRRAILRAFEAGSLSAVFAIKVLDEGFDMPGVLGAILLASSRNERQFIQRRGRVLRTAEGKKKAFIWDFLVSGRNVMPEDYAKELAEMELRRCIEFSRLSLNWEEQQNFLRDYCVRYECDFQALYEESARNRFEE